MKPLEIARIAETIEMDMREALWDALPKSLAAKRGMQRYCVGGADVSLTRKSISLQRNRVLGLGVKEPANEGMMDAIMEHFRAARVTRFSFHVSPTLQSDEITEWLKSRGFTLHHRYAKLFRAIDTPAKIASPLKVRRAGKAHASEFVDVFLRIFPWPADLGAWLEATFGKEGFSHFLALDGDRPVAVGLLYATGKSAWLGFGGTLTQYRRRGAHGALIAARIKHAAEIGAQFVVCETLEPVPRRPSGSYRNMLNAGFEQAYLRPIWVWEKG